jgi:HK97 gp10 family phage protein
MPTEIRVEGTRELIKSLRAVNQDLPRELTKLHKELAEPLAEQMRSSAPSRSGQLASSIRAQGGQRYARVAAGKKAVPYAGPIHWGWPARNIEAQPFMATILEDRADQTTDHYLELLDQFLDRVWETI